MARQGSGSLFGFRLFYANCISHGYTDLGIAAICAIYYNMFSFTSKFLMNGGSPMSGCRRITAFLIAVFLLLGTPVHASGEASAQHEGAGLYPNGLVIQNTETFAPPEGRIVP